MNRKTGLLIGSIAFSCVSGQRSAYAVETKEFARCAAIEDSVSRLACYDSLSTQVGTAKSKGHQPKAGRWNIEHGVSPVDDSPTVVLSLSAESKIDGWPGKSTIPTLVLRCQEKAITAYVVTGMSPSVEKGLLDSATATLRFDKEDAFHDVMSQATNHEALFFSSSKDIIKKMLAHRALLFGFTPFNSSPVITTFKLDGLDRAIEPLAKACNWDRADIEGITIRAPIRVIFKDGRSISGYFASYSKEVGKLYIWTGDPETDQATQSFSAADLSAVVSDGTTFSIPAFPVTH